MNQIEINKMKHYALSIKSHDEAPDYEDGIMAESLEDAVKRFQDALDTGLSDEELAKCIIQI